MAAAWVQMAFQVSLFDHIVYTISLLPLLTSCLISSYFNMFLYENFLLGKKGHFYKTLGIVWCHRDNPMHPSQGTLHRQWCDGSSWFYMFKLDFWVYLWNNPVKVPGKILFWSFLSLFGNKYIACGDEIVF